MVEENLVPDWRDLVVLDVSRGGERKNSSLETAVCLYLSPNYWLLVLENFFNLRFGIANPCWNVTYIMAIISHFLFLLLFLPFFLPHYRWECDMVITIGVYLQIGEKKKAQPKRQQANTHYMRAIHFLWLALVTAEIVGEVGLLLGSHTGYRPCSQRHLCIWHWEAVELRFYSSFPFPVIWVVFCGLVRGGETIIICLGQEIQLYF